MGNQVQHRSASISTSASALSVPNFRSAQQAHRARLLVCLQRNHSEAPVISGPQACRLRPAVDTSQTSCCASAGFGAAAPDDFRSAELDVTKAIKAETAATAARSKGLSGLAARVVFGTALGIVGALVILTGGWCYMLCACFVAYQASQEYFGFLTSKVSQRSLNPSKLAMGVFHALNCMHAWNARLCALSFVRCSKSLAASWLIHITCTLSRFCAMTSIASVLPVHIACTSFLALITVSLQGISAGMQPPPPLITAHTTLSCIGLVVWTFVSQGRSTAALPVTAFAVLSLQLLTTKKTRFAQLTSSVFGLFYCGAVHTRLCLPSSSIWPMVLSTLATDIDHYFSQPL